MRRLRKLFGRVAARVRLVLATAKGSMRYARELELTPAVDRPGWPELRAWALPMCWIRGHAWGNGSTFEISPHRLQWCDRCREEVAHRTAWAQVEPLPMYGEDLPWFGFDPADEGDVEVHWMQRDGEAYLLGMDPAREDAPQ